MSSKGLKSSVEQRPDLTSTRLRLEAGAYPPGKQPDLANTSVESLLYERTINDFESDQYQEQRKTSATLTKHNGWTDISILLGFGALHLLFIATIVVLDQCDKRDSGFYIAKLTNQYIWKFGPTFIFVVVLAFWRQVDIRIKYRAPWIEMLKGSRPASMTVLLDYVTPILPSSIIAAMRNKHWDVAASAGVFVLLKVATVLSTGLLAINPANVRTRQANITLALGPPADTRLAAYDSVGLSYAGTLQHGLGWPDRTLPYAAFQEPITKEVDLLSEASIAADVFAFYPELDCEVANISSTFLFSDPTVTTLVGRAEPTTTPSRGLSISVTSKDFSGTTTINARGCSPETDSCEPLSIAAHVSDLNSFQWNVQQGTIDGRIFVMVIALESKSDPSSVAQNYSQGLYQSTLRGNGWIQKQAWSAALMCSTNYSIETGKLIVNTTSPEEPRAKALSQPNSRTRKQIDGYNFTTLRSDVSMLAARTATYLELSYPNQTVPFEWSSQANIWFWLGSQEGGDLDLLQLRNLTLLQAVSDRAFKGLASYWVGQWLSFPEHQTTNGSYTYLEAKLRVSPLVEWSIAGLIAGSAMCVLLLLISHFRTQFSYPMSLIDDAVIAKRSFTFMHHLGQWNPSMEALKSTEISSLKFSVSPSDNAINLELTGKNIIKRSDNDQKIGFAAGKPGNHLWQPISTKMWFLGISIGAAACAIVALEVVQRVSDRSNNGLVLKSNSLFVRDIINLLPVSILVTIATLFSCTESTLALMSTYILLAKTPSKLRTVDQNSMANLPPFAILNHAKRGQFGIALVLLASLLGSILTIISAGLLSTHIVSDTQKTSVIVLDEFDLNINISSSGNGSRAFTFLQREEAQFPLGTFNEFVYPLFKLNDTDPTVERLRNENRSSSIEVDMPILRPSLNCSVVPETDFKVSAPNVTVWRWYGTLFPWANVSYTASLPDSCQFARGVYEQSKQYTIQSPSSWVVNDENTTTCANIIAVNGVDTRNQSHVIEPSYTRIDVYPSGCPSLAILVGSFKLFQTDTSTTSMLVCNQFIEQIPATLTFDIPSLALNLSAKPVLRAMEAKVVSRPTWNFVNLFTGYIDAADSLAQNRTDNIQVDSFFATVTNNTNISVTDFLGHENVDKLLNATQHLYRRYVAQRIGIDMRVTTRNQSAVDESLLKTIGSTLNAKISNPSMLGIVQNRSSKIALQSMLGIMIICLIAGIPDCRAAGKTLILSPCTFVGRLGPLNGSTFVDRIDASKTSKELYQEWKDVNLRFGRRIQQVEGAMFADDTIARSEASKVFVNNEGGPGIDLAELVQS